MPALSADLPQLKQSLAALSGSQQAIVPYALAMVEVPLGPQQGQLDGSTFTYDPLAGLPALERQLSGAKQHVLDYEGQVDQPLHVWAIMNLPDFNATFQSAAADLLAVLKQVPAGGTPSAARRAQANGSLQKISAGLAALMLPLDGVQSALGPTLTQIAQDHGALTDGAEALSAYIPQLQNDIVKSQEQYVGTIAGDAIINLIGQIGSQQIGALQALQAQLKVTIIDSEAATLAMAALMDALSTISAKAQAIQSDLQDAGDDQFAADLESLDLAEAREDWQQFNNYVAGLGL